MSESTLFRKAVSPSVFMNVVNFVLIALMVYGLVALVKRRHNR